MPFLRKARAILLLGLISGVCWGFVATVVRVGLDIYTRIELPFWHLFTRITLPYAGIGFVAGMIYASAIALLPPSDERKGVSAIRGGLFGALGGVAVFLAGVVVARYLGYSVPPSQYLRVGGVFGVVGASTGLAILGIAKRGKVRGEIAGGDGNEDLVLGAATLSEAKGPKLRA